MKQAVRKNIKKLFTYITYIVWYKGIKILICFYFNTIVFNALIFCGWLFVTYGIDTEVLHPGIVPKPKLWYWA